MEIKNETKQFMILTENEHYKLLDKIDISQSYEVRKIRLYLMPSVSKVYDNNMYVELEVKIKKNKRGNKNDNVD